MYYLAIVDILAWVKSIYIAKENLVHCQMFTELCTYTYMQAYNTVYGDTVTPTILTPK